MDLSGRMSNFYPSLTDNGICNVFNGNSLLSTFKPGGKIDWFGTSLDQRPESKLEMIDGTGHLYQKMLWLNVADNSLKNHISSIPKRKGSAMVSVNEWLSYFNVRMNQIEVLAGQEVRLKIKPLVHVASDNFRSLTLEHRQCLFHDEITVQKHSKNFCL